MIARIQGILFLGYFLTALLMAAALASEGRWPFALGIVLIAITAHAAVLAIEFLVAARINVRDPAPRPSRRETMAAWWGETIHAPLVFCWRQPFRSARWPDLTAPLALTRRRSVILVHGFVCNRGLWNRWLPRLRDAGIPHIAVNLEPAFGSIDDYRQIIEDAVASVEARGGLAPVVVAHSMGGLAVRRWWVDTDAARIHRLITIGTPHRGTWLARWARSENGRQMQLDSAWQQELDLREGQHRAMRMTCFYGHCDNIVFPASTATFPGADNRHLRGVAHVQMADHPEPLAEAVRQTQLD